VATPGELPGELLRGAYVLMSLPGGCGCCCGQVLAHHLGYSISSQLTALSHHFQPVHRVVQIRRRTLYASVHRQHVRPSKVAQMQHRHPMNCKKMYEPRPSLKNSFSVVKRSSEPTQLFKTTRVVKNVVV